MGYKKKKKNSYVSNYSWSNIQTCKAEHARTFAYQCSTHALTDKQCMDALCILPTLVLLKGQVLKQEIGGNEDVRDKRKGCEKNTRKQRERDDFRTDCVANNFFCNPILFAICTSTFSKLCKNMYTCIQWHVEECSVELLCN
jgi:hypothetical protein